MLAPRSRYGVASARLLIAASSWLAVLPAWAAETSQPRQIVVRVSREALDPFVEKQVDTTRPVAETVLGTYVTGKARTTGKPAVDFVPNPRQATFVVSLKGATVSRTVGTSGPATIYTRAETFFTATKEIRFEPGKGFVAQPAKITARTRAITEGIGTRRGGLIGRIVSRRAWARVNQVRPQVEAIARQKAERRIAAAFDDYLKTKLARLNRMTDVRPTLAVVLGSEGAPRFISRTTRDHLEIAAAPANAPGQFLLPAATAQSDATFQIFVHNSLFGRPLAGAFELLDRTDGETSLAGRALAAVPDVLRHRLGVPEIPPLPIRTGPNLGYQKADDWIVVNIGGEGTPNGEVLVAAEQPRVWTSADGRYRCYAEKVDVTDEAVTLKRISDGQVVTVPLVRLSEADRNVVLR
jgi:hypothetical protein